MWKLLQIILLWMKVKRNSTPVTPTDTSTNPAGTDKPVIPEPQPEPLKEMKMIKLYTADFAWLYPPMKEAVEKVLIPEVKRVTGLVYGEHWKCTCTARTTLMQVLLYLQGRMGLSVLNQIRASSRIGLWALGASEDHQVTWVLNSKHLITLPEDRAKAFDFAIITDKNKGTLSWNAKVSVDGDDIPDFTEIGQVAEQCGFRWGGRFGDLPHIEWVDTQ